MNMSGSGPIAGMARISLIGCLHWAHFGRRGCLAMPKHNKKREERCAPCL
jgi:hypothetical protein